VVVEPNGADGYTILEGMLRFKGRIVIRDGGNLKQKILQTLHELLVREHSGIQNIYLKVKQIFYWPNLRRDVKNFVLVCDISNRCKLENVSYPGILQPLPIPDRAWTSVAMDFVEGMPKSEGKDSVMVVVDRFSKFALFIGLAHPYTAKEVARVDRVVSSMEC